MPLLLVTSRACVDSLVMVLLVALVAPTKPVLAQTCELDGISSAQEPCNVRSSVPLFERSMPTWTAMGMPLVVNSDMDVALKIVEKDIDTSGCFRWCDADNNPVGYRNGAVTRGQDRGELEDAGIPFQRQEGLQPCTGDLEFEIAACAFDIQVNLLSGAGDDATELREDEIQVAVGLWDPAGGSQLDGLKKVSSGGGGRGRRLSGDDSSSAGRGGGGRGRRRLDETQDGQRQERFVEFPNAHGLGKWSAAEERVLNPYTQSPRGSLVIAIGSESVTGIREFLAGTVGLPGDGMTGAGGATRVAPAVSLVTIFALLFRRDPSWVTLLAIATLIPLVASQALCGCPERMEVALTVPKGFAFSEFRLDGGAGAVACASCVGDTSSPRASAPYTSDSGYEQNMHPTFFDPRVFMGRPLKIETDVSMTILFKNHGTTEAASLSVEDCDDCGNDSLIGSDGSLAMDVQIVDGETAKYVQEERMRGSDQAESHKGFDSLSRASFVSVEAQRKVGVQANVAATASKEAFTISAGSSVIAPATSSGWLTGPLRMVFATMPVISLVCINNKASVLLILVIGLATCTVAQYGGSDVVVVLDVPDGLCLPSIEGLGSNINCAECAMYTCANRNSTGAGLATAASDPDLLQQFLLEGQFTTKSDSRICAAGSAPVLVEVAAEVLNNDTIMPLDGASGTFPLPFGRKVGCHECPSGTFARQVGADCIWCAYESRCGKGNRCNYNFTGQACGVCKAGYHQLPEDDDYPDGWCELCPEATFLGYTLLALGFVASIGTFVLMTIKAEQVDAAEEKVSAVQELIDMIKATLGYLQTLVMILGIKSFQPPRFLIDFGQKLKQFAFLDIAEIFSDISLPVDCITTSEESSGESVFWGRFFTSQGLFWVLATGSVILHFAFSGSDRINTARPLLPGFNRPTSSFLATVGTCYTNLYIVLLSTAAIALDCEDDAEGTSRLSAFPEIECWGSEALAMQSFALVLLLAYIMIWVVSAANEPDSSRSPEIDTDMSSPVWADFFKKTFLVLSAVFLDTWPWVAWILLVVVETVYLALEGVDLVKEDSDDVSLAEFVRMVQLLGMWTLVFFSFYFILYTEEEYGYAYYVVMFFVGVFNSVAVILTPVGVAKYWYDLCTKIADAIDDDASEGDKATTMNPIDDDSGDGGDKTAKPVTPNPMDDGSSDGNVTMAQDAQSHDANHDSGQ